MFSAEEGLAQSQDWWLRDQANLAAGFENWMMDGRSGAESSAIVDDDYSTVGGSLPGYPILTGNGISPSGNTGLKRNRDAEKEWYGDV